MPVKSVKCHLAVEKRGSSTHWNRHLPDAFCIEYRVYNWIKCCTFIQLDQLNWSVVVGHQLHYHYITTTSANNGQCDRTTPKYNEVQGSRLVPGMPAPLPLKELSTITIIINVMDCNNYFSTNLTLLRSIWFFLTNFYQRLDYVEHVFTLLAIAR